MLDLKLLKLAIEHAQVTAKEVSETSVFFERDEIVISTPNRGLFSVVIQSSFSECECYSDDIDECYFHEEGDNFSFKFTYSDFIDFVKKIEEFDNDDALEISLSSDMDDNTTLELSCNPQIYIKSVE